MFAQAKLNYCCYWCCWCCRCCRWCCWQTSCPETPSERADKSFKEGRYWGLDIFQNTESGKTSSVDCRRDSWRAGLFDAWAAGHDIADPTNPKNPKTTSCSNNAWVHNDDDQVFYVHTEDDCRAAVEQHYMWLAGNSSFGSCWRHDGSSCGANALHADALSSESACTVTGVDTGANVWVADACHTACGETVVANETTCEESENIWTAGHCTTAYGFLLNGIDNQVQCAGRIWVNGSCTHTVSNDDGTSTETTVYTTNETDCRGHKWTRPEWQEESPRIYAYVISLYWSLTTMTTIGYGDYGPATRLEIVFVLFAEIIGLSFFAVLLDQINNLNGVLGKQETESNEIKNEVIGFMKTSQVPAEHIHSTIAFLNFKATSNSGSTIAPGDERFALLSQPLKRRIKIALFKPALINVKMLGWAKDSIDEQIRVEQMFHETDEDDGGTLDVQEIRMLIVDKLGLSMTEEETHNAFREMNSGSSVGDVDLEEFEQWWFMKKFGVPKIQRPPVEFLNELAFILNSKTQAVAPSDIIVDEGNYGDRMYFLLAGTFMVKTKKPGQVRFSDHRYYTKLNFVRCCRSWSQSVQRRS